MATTIQLRRDTAANWAAANHTLASGEAGYETDTGKLKIGTGSTAWNSLAYFVGAAGPTGPAGPPLPIVNAVATANVATLSGTATIDGVALSAGQVAFLVAQTTGSQNGPWTIAAGAWTRPTWFASGSTYTGVTLVALPGGTTWGSTEWFLTNTSTVTVDTTALTWAVLPPSVVQGTHANRPTAAAWNRNLVYFETDTGLEYQNWSGSAWTQITSGTELAVAENTTNQTSTTVGGFGSLITGLSISLIAPLRPFYLRTVLPVLQISASGLFGTLFITDNTPTNINQTTVVFTSAGGGFFNGGIHLEARLPVSGGFSITPGNTYTFQVQAAVSAAGTLTVLGSSVIRPRLSAIAA